MPALLRVLFIGFAWLPIAFALYSIQSVWYLDHGDFVSARAGARAVHRILRQSARGDGHHG
jgi:uncharacterized protein involved in response to NO